MSDFDCGCKQLIEANKRIEELQARVAKLEEAIKEYKRADDYYGQYSHLFEAQETIADVMQSAVEGLYKVINETSSTWLGSKLEEACKQEREACAKMVEHILKEGGSTYGDAIRARSK